MLIIFLNGLLFPDLLSIYVCIFWHVYVDTHQLLLLHTLHENDEQMLGLCAAVGECLLDGHQQLVS